MKLKNFHLIFLTIIVALTVTSSPLNETTKTAETTETTETDVLEVDPADLWSYTPDQLIQFSKKVLQKEIDAINVILSVPDEECNFDNIIAPIARHLENDVYKYSYTVNLMTYVHPDENMVNAAYTCVGILFSGIEPYFYTQELYGKVKKVFENIENGKYAVPKDPEDLRLLEDVRNEFIAYGIEYSPEVAEKLVALNNKIGALTQEFQRCLIKDNPSITFTKEELDGVTDEFFEDLETTTKDGQEAYIVILKKLKYTEIIQSAKNENTRKVAMEAYLQRCKSNIDVVRDLANKRFEIAKIKGYKSHSQLKLENNMAESPENVMKFLNELKSNLQPVAKKEIEKLLEIKKQEKEALNETFDNTLNSWDLDYYKKILVQNEYSISSEDVKPYFPIDSVTEEILDLYEDIFSFKFIKVENPKVWHPDVMLYEIYDKKSKEYLGSFYLDLYPREGKTEFVSNIPLIYGYEKEDGTRYYPVGSLIGNFPKPTSSKPSLLKHGEVVTYLHELGHVFHQICSETKWARHNGFNVETDFLETPSQMLENLMWEKDVIRRISHHYKYEIEKMPYDLINSIIKSKNSSAGLYYLQQILYDIVDMKIHSITEVDETMDLVKLWNDEKEDIMMIKGIDNTWPIAAFTHIISGYDAGYYSYIWSQVYAADIYFSKFRPSNFLIINSSNGRKYREAILKKGSTGDSMQLLRDYLGREPSDAAFVKSLEPTDTSSEKNKKLNFKFDFKNKFFEDEKVEEIRDNIRESVNDLHLKTKNFAKKVENIFINPLYTKNKNGKKQ